MEELEEETIGFDAGFEIECIIYSALEKTISCSIEEELRKDTSETPVIAKELMLKNILARNIEGLEEQQYITVGPENKVYLCGSWLMRSVISSDNSPIPMLEYLQRVTDCTNIVFLPNKTGSELRKELWFAKNHDNPSYDLPKDCRIAPPETPPLGGPPPGAMGMHGMAGRPPFPPQ